MKRVAAILSPCVFVIFTACGGGDDPPPPLASNPATTPEIQCADARLTDALDKCKSGVNDVLPLIMASGSNRDNTALLIAALSKPDRRPPPRPPIGGNNDKCQKPQVDKTTSCNDDLITALLLWKSAPKKDNTLAIYDSFYRQYLFKRIKDYLNQSAAQMQLSEQQQRALRDKLKYAFASGVLNRGVLSPSEAGTLSRYFGPSESDNRNRPLTLLGDTRGTDENFASTGPSTSVRRPGARNSPMRLNLNGSSTGVRPSRTIGYQDFNGKAESTEVSEARALSMGVTTTIPREAMRYGLPSSAARRPASASTLTVRRTE